MRKVAFVGSFSVFAFIVGASISGLICKNLTAEYITERLGRYEGTSDDAFRNRTDKVNRFLQTDYMIMLREAYSYGFIEENEFNRRIAIANLRICLRGKENEPEIDERFCDWARDHWSSVDEKRNFEDVMEEQKRIFMKNDRGE